jgi:hypothetical protein
MTVFNPQHISYYYRYPQQLEKMEGVDDHEKIVLDELVAKLQTFLGESEVALKSTWIAMILRHGRDQFRTRVRTATASTHTRSTHERHIGG